MTVRPPLIAKPLHGITFMHKPPILYRTAAIDTYSVPFCRSFIESPCLKYKNPSVHVWTEGVKTRYHLWFTCFSQNKPHRVQALCAVTGASRHPLLNVQGATQRGIHTGPLSFLHQPKALCAGSSVLLILVTVFNFVNYIVPSAICQGLEKVDRTAKTVRSTIILFYAKIK